MNAQEAPKQKETLKTQLQDVLAKAIDCKTMAESVSNDLVPSAAVDSKPGSDVPPPATAAAIVQQTLRVLSDVQALLRDVRETLAG